MRKLVSFRLPQDILEGLQRLAREESKDKSEVIRELLVLGMKEKKLNHSIQLYKEGRATLWKAAREANLSLWQMIEILRERKIELQYGVKELEEDLNALRE